MTRKLIEQLADALGHFDDVDKTESAITAAREYLAQSEQSEPLTDGYVQRVPDKCDRIVWRNSYYHLPIRQPAPPLRELRDEEIFSIAIRCNLRDGHDFHDLQDFATSILAAARSKTP